MTRHLVTATALCLTACTSTGAFDRVGTEKVLAQALVSDEQEAQLGLQVHNELTAQNVKFSTDPELTAYVEGLAVRLLGQARKERDLRWSWFVIDDLNTVNAFATPGGRIYVYTGLLKAAKNEAEVAGVLGHEIGHVVGRHSARQLVAQKGFETVVAMALGKDPNSVAQVVAGLTGKGLLMAYGRTEEIEADESGARYASAMGWDPHGLVTFFDGLTKAKGDTPQLLTWLSTHPSNAERIANLNRVIAEQRLNGSDLGADRLAAIQKKLK